jgi:SlyX protein
MESIENVDGRLTELEVKASFGEDLMDQLNQVIVRQQTQIEALIREVGRLNQAHSDGARGSERHLRDELPPHY